MTRERALSFPLLTLFWGGLLLGLPYAALASAQGNEKPAAHCDDGGSHSGHGHGGHASPGHEGHGKAAPDTHTSDPTAQTPLQLVRLPDAQLVDQEGREVSLNALVAGRRAAINFVFTSCTTVCPPMGALFARMQRDLEARGDDDVAFISISIDPAVDSPRRLKAWSERFDGSDDWRLLTGSKLIVDDVLKDLGVFTALKEQHAPLILLGDPRSQTWIRAHGLAPPRELIAVLDGLPNAEPLQTAEKPARKLPGTVSRKLPGTAEMPGRKLPGTVSRKLAQKLPGIVGNATSRKLPGTVSRKLAQKLPGIVGNATSRKLPGTVQKLPGTAQKLPGTAQKLPGTVGNDKAREYFTDTVLVDQHGESRRFYSDLIAGRTVVINPFFATCSGSCPVMHRALRQAQSTLADRLGRDVFFLSITVDPEGDTPDRLKAYADAFDAGPGWSFLTGAQDDVDRVLAKLGQQVSQKEAHQAIFLVGNERTGLWQKVFGLGPPEDLLAAVKAAADDSPDSPPRNDVSLTSNAQPSQTSPSASTTSAQGDLQ